MSGKRNPGLNKALGPRQAAILEYLWVHGPQSVTELHTGLAKAGPVAYTTVFTELSRMLEKKIVVKGNDGGSHLDMRYRAALTREAVISSVVAQTLASLMDAHGAAAVHGFVDALADDDQALAALRRALGKRSRKLR